MADWFCSSRNGIPSALLIKMDVSAPQLTLEADSHVIIAQPFQSDPQVGDSTPVEDNTAQNDLILQFQETF